MSRASYNGTGRPWYLRRYEAEPAVVLYGRPSWPSACEWTVPFSRIPHNALADAQALCVWHEGQVRNAA